LDDLDALDELDDLVDRAERAYERRNSIVHHQWCIEPKTGHVFVIKESARKRVESNVLHMTSPVVEEIALEIYNVGLALYVFANNHNLLPTIPSGPRPRHHKSRAERKKRRAALLHVKIEADKRK
jgi:hypothetical protein